MLEDPDDEPRKDIDKDDDDARDGIASNELRGTIHGTVEVSFLLDLLPATLRFCLGNQTGVQVGIDAHLLARHRVESEPRSDFSNTSGTVGDDHELDDDKDDEDHDTDDVTAPDHDRPEGLNDVTGKPIQED